MTGIGFAEVARSLETGFSDCPLASLSKAFSPETVNVAALDKPVAADAEAVRYFASCGEESSFAPEWDNQILQRGTESAGETIGESTGDVADGHWFPDNSPIDVYTAKGTAENVELSDDGGKSLDQIAKGEEETLRNPSDVVREWREEHTKVIDGKTYYYDDNGKLFRIDNQLEANTEYEVNGYTYKTDGQGRIVSAEGKLHLKDWDSRLKIDEKTDSIKDIGKGDQKETDERGHLIGDQFGGSNGLENMIPQDAEINKKDYKNFENELAKEVKAGKNVHVKVEPHYDGDSHRPTEIRVTYTINGEVNVRTFPNN